MVEISKGHDTIKRIALLIIYCLILSSLASANGVYSGKETLVQMSFNQAEIRDVFDILAEISGYNIVLHKDVGGRITIKLDQVSFHDSLHLITRMMDYDFIQLNHTFFIGRPYKLQEMLDEEGARIFSLQYISVQEAQDFIATILPGLEQFPHRDKKILVLKGASKDLDRAQSIMNKLDRDVFVERDFLFYPLQYGDVQQIASILRSLLPQLRVEPDESRQQLILWGHYHELVKAQELLKDLDRDTSKDREVQIYLIDDLDGRQLSMVISSIFPDLLVVVDEVSRNLILTGNKSELQQAVELLQRLKREISISQEIQFYICHYMDSVDAASALASIIPNLKVELEQHTGNLILIGTREEIEKGRRILSQLDVDISKEQEILFLPLQYASSPWVSSILGDLLPGLFWEVDERNQDLIIIGTTAELERAQRIVSRLDREVEDDQQIHFYPLRYVDSSQVAPIIRTLVPALVVEEERTRNLILKGRGSEIQKAKELLAELDRELMRDKEVSFYPIQYSSPQQLAPIIRSFVPGLMVEVEERTKNLILGGTPEEIQLAIEFIQQLDKEVMEDRDFYFYPLQYVIADKVVPILHSLVPDLLVEMDRRNNNLILSASKGEIEKALQILEELDKEIMLEVEISVYPLQYVDGEKVAPLLISLLPHLQVETGVISGELILMGTEKEIQQAKELLKGFDRRTDAKEILFFPLNYADQDQIISILSTLVPDLLIELDQKGDLILMGKVNDLNRASNLILELDRQQFKIEEQVEEVKESSIQVIPIRNADALEISYLLMGLFPGLMVEVENRTGHLILKGIQGDIHKAHEIILQLDKELTFHFEVRVVQLQHTQVEQVLFLLRTLIPELIIEVEEKSRTLIMKGKEEDLILAEEILSRLDVETKGETSIKIIKVHYADVNQLSSLLPTLVPGLMVDVQGQYLILRGTPIGLEKTEDLLVQLDQDLKEEEELRVFTLKHSDVVQLSSLLPTLIPGLKIGVEGQNLLISGTTLQLNRIEGLLLELDNQEIIVEEGKEIQIYPIKQADKVQLSSLLPSLVPGLKVDYQGQNLILRGTLDQLKRAQSLLLELDDEVLEKEEEIKVFPIRQADVVQLSSLLPILVPGLKVESDGRNLILRAHSGQLKIAEDLLKELDKEIHDEKEVLKVFPIRQADVVQLSSLLSSLVPGLKVESEGRNLVVRGTLEELIKVEALLMELDQEVKEEEEDLKVFSLKQADVLQLSSLLPILVPGLKVESEGRNLIMRGKEEQLKKAEALLMELDQEVEEEEEEIKIFPIKEADILQLSSLLPTLVPGLKADSEGRNLIMRGTMEQLKKAETLLLEIDGEEKDAQEEIKIFSIKHADVGQLSSLLPSLVPGLKVESEGRNLIVKGTIEQLARTEVLLLELDQLIREDEAADIKIFPIGHADVAQLSSLLSSLILGLKVEVEGRNLIISGSQQDLKKAELLLLELDQDVKDREEIRVFPIIYADVLQLSSLLSSLLPEIVVGVEERTKNMIIRATSKDMVKVETILLDLDKEVKEEKRDVLGELENKQELKIFSLHYADVGQVASILSSFFPDLKIEKDTFRKLLILMGPKTQLLAVEDLLASLDREIQKENQLEVQEVEERDWKVEVFSLQFAQSPSIARILSTILPQLLIEAEERTNFLIIAGQEKDIEKASQLLRELDRDVAKEEVHPVIEGEILTKDRKISVLKLEHVSVLEIRPLMTTFFTSIDVEVLEQGNLLIMSGEDTLLLEAKELLAMIDREPLYQKKDIHLSLKGITGDHHERIAFIHSHDKTFIVKAGDMIEEYLVMEVRVGDVLLKDDRGGIFVLHLGGGYSDYR